MDKIRDIEDIRLNRYLAMIGVGSRRSCDEIILDGRVAINGHIVREPGTKVVPGVTRLTLDKTPLQSPRQPIVLLLNKPTGVVSTVSDESGRTTVLDFCKKYLRGRRLFPVGRLDINTTGVILLTNDGMLCYRLTHPRHGIPRVYQVRVRGAMSEKKLLRLKKIVSSSRQGRKKPSSVELIKELDRESLLKVTLHEGRHRQVRKMCELVGLRVVKLRRVSFGPISVRKLPLGAVRPLTRKELESLQRTIA